MEPKSLRWTSADGGRLHALDWAGADDRLPIIGVPGLNRNGSDFAPLASWLAGERRVIGIDLRGRRVAATTTPSRGKNANCPTMVTMWRG